MGHHERTDDMTTTAPTALALRETLDLARRAERAADLAYIYAETDGPRDDTDTEYAAWTHSLDNLRREAIRLATIVDTLTVLARTQGGAHQPHRIAAALDIPTNI